MARSDNQVVLVTGGTGGLGRAVAQAFLAEGATVVVSYRHQQEFEQLRALPDINAARLHGYSLDVTDEAAGAAVLQSIVQQHQRLDVLVNTVGGYQGGATLWQQAATALEQMLNLNLRSIYALSRSILPQMMRQGRGSVVNVSAKAALDHPAGASAYAASKAAALTLMECLAAEVQGSGVRVNSVLPSIIDTDANRRAMPGADFSRWPKPDAIARVILFLCGAEAEVIHGAAVPVYGAR